MIERTFFDRDTIRRICKHSEGSFLLWELIYLLLFGILTSHDVGETWLRLQGDHYRQEIQEREFPRVHLRSLPVQLHSKLQVINCNTIYKYRPTKSSHLTYYQAE
jgi:hypothetical protein